MGKREVIGGAIAGLLICQGQALALNMHIVPRAEEPTTLERPTEPLGLDFRETQSPEDLSREERGALLRPAKPGSTLQATLAPQRHPLAGLLGSVVVPPRVLGAAVTTPTTGTAVPAPAASPAAGGAPATDKAAAPAAVGTPATPTTTGTAAAPAGAAAAPAEGGAAPADGATAAGTADGSGEGVFPAQGEGAGEVPFETPAPEATPHPKAAPVSRSAPSYTQFLAVPTDKATPPTEKKNPVSVNISTEFYDVDNNNPDRAIRDTTVGNFYQSTPSLGLEHTFADGTVLRGQLNGRLTDEPQLVRAEFGRRFTVQGEPFVEVNQGGNYLARVGFVQPQFTPYTVQASGLGTHLIKQLKHDNAVTELQFFAARMDRRVSPSTLDRLGSGVRASNQWNFQKNGTLQVSGQFTTMRDDPNSLNEPFTGSELFNLNDVGSFTGAYDHPSGIHVAAERAFSQTEFNRGGTVVNELGYARRQQLAYQHAKTGRLIRFEHERIDARFTALRGSDGDDLDHQSVGIEVPITAKLRLNAGFDRVYNDIYNTLLTRSENHTYNVDLGADPWQGNKNRYLAGFHTEVGGTFSKNDSRDRTLDTFNRDLKLVVQERVGRFSAAYNLAPRNEAEYTSTVDTWSKTKSTYSMDYQIVGGRNGYWNATPRITYAHDHDTNFDSKLIDLKDNVAYSLDGKYGRNTFGWSHTSDRARLRNAGSVSNSSVYSANVQVPLDAVGNRKCSFTYSSNSNLNGALAPINDRKVLASVSSRW